MTVPPSLRGKNLIQCHYADTLLTQVYFIPQIEGGGR